MNPSPRKTSLSLLASGIFAVALASGCAMSGMGGGVKVTLNGANEVPPNSSNGTGHGSIKIASDKSVSGSIMTMDVNGVAAHIHEGAPGKNGPVIVPLTKTGDASWSVPAGATLTDSQYDSYKAGNLYVNVHSPSNKAGEIRGQINP